MKTSSPFTLVDITPAKASCAPLPVCPGVFKSSRGTYVIVGKILKPADAAALPAGRVAADETVVEVPMDLIDLLNNQ